MKIQEFSSIQEKIIDRAIYLVGKEGRMDIPVREIAKTAEVNVAAINYHFSSKDKMLTFLENRIIKRFSQVLTLLFDQKLTPEDRLISWASEVILYIQMYPGISILLNKQIQSPVQNHFGKTLSNLIKKNFKELRKILPKVLNETHKDIIEYKLSFLISSILHPFSLSQNKRLNKKLLKDHESRESLLKMLIQSLKKS